MICYAIQKQFYSGKKTGAPEIDIPTQAIRQLASLLHYRQLPFDEISKLIELLFNVIDTRRTSQLKDPASAPDTTPADFIGFISRVLHSLIKNLPVDVPKAIVTKKDPLLPPLSWWSLRTLERLIERVWHSDELRLRVIDQKRLPLYRVGSEAHKLHVQAVNKAARVSANDDSTFDILYALLSAEEKEQKQGLEKASEALEWSLDTAHDVDPHLSPTDKSRMNMIAFQDPWISGKKPASEGEYRGPVPVYSEFQPPPPGAKQQEPNFRELVSVWHSMTDNTRRRGRGK